MKITIEITDAGLLAGLANARAQYNAENPGAPLAADEDMAAHVLNETLAGWAAAMPRQLAAKLERLSAADAAVVSTEINARYAVKKAADVAASPAPAPAPAPTPAPAPAPAPAPIPVITSGSDTALLQSMLNDGICLLDDRVYTLTDPLLIGAHGVRMGSKSGRLPPRANTPVADQWGPILRYAGPDQAILVKRGDGKGKYISGVKVGGFRIEAPNAKQCIDAWGVATSVFHDLALIGPTIAQQGVVMRVRGGIQTTFRNVDFCGMGYPEAIPHGDFSLRAVAGLQCEPGTDENGNMTSPFTGFVADDCYFHQCRAGAINYAGLITFQGQCIFEDNLVGLMLGDTARSMVLGAYWEANRESLIRIGAGATLTLVAAEMNNTANAPYFFDGAGFRSISIHGGYTKGPGTLFSPQCVPQGPGSFSAAYGVPLPYQADIGPLTIVGPDGRGAAY